MKKIMILFIGMILAMGAVSAQEVVTYDYHWYDDFFGAFSVVGDIYAPNVASGEQFVFKTKIKCEQASGFNTFTYGYIFPGDTSITKKRSLDYFRSCDAGETFYLEIRDNAPFYDGCDKNVQFWIKHQRHFSNFQGDDVIVDDFDSVNIEGFESAGYLHYVCGTEALECELGNVLGKECYKNKLWDKTQMGTADAFGNCNVGLYDGKVCEYGCKDGATSCYSAGDVLLSNGKTCIRDELCKSGHCVFGKCSAELADESESCLKDSECKSGDCDTNYYQCLSGTIIDEIEEEIMCESTEDCSIGECVDGLCLSFPPDEEVVEEEEEEEEEDRIICKGSEYKEQVGNCERTLGSWFSYIFYSIGQFFKGMFSA